MPQTDTISRRQTVAAAFVAILSPLIRRFPRVLTATAGRTAWLSPLLAVIPAAAMIALCYFFFRRRSTPTDFASLLTDALGEFTGKAVTVLYTAWILFYAGFLLRSGAVRFVSTVYPGAESWLFIAVTALLCGLAACGSLRAIARAAMLFRPLLILVLAAAVGLTLRDVDFSLLLPVTADDLLPNGFAAAQTANVFSVAACLLFLGDRVEGRLQVRDFAPWCAALLLIVCAMTACCIGMFGPALTAKLAFPFFMLLRDVTVLGSLERAEPVIIALWVFSDFILISLLLLIAGKNLRFCFGRETASAGGGIRRALPTVFSTAAAAAVGLLVAREMRQFDFFSETVVPLGNALAAFVLPLPILLIGLVRRKL